MFSCFRTLHFVGIGGIGMSGIAEVLHNLGYEVTGSDLRDSETASRLRSLGITVSIGHRPENIGNAHVIVVSSAVKTDNPEVQAAKRRGIPIIPRAEMLAELGRLKYGILVAGAHGKTTTTSLIATVLSDGNLDPTVVIGGKLNAMGTNAKLGQGQYLVAEADESDGSFLRLNPTVAIITNIDREHLDFFGSLENIKRAFIEFANKIPFYGFSVLCLEDQNVREIMPFIERRHITYGLTSQADIFASNIAQSEMSMTFDATYRGSAIGLFHIPMPGVHNVLNSLATIATAIELEVSMDTIKDSLRGFKGIHRRLQHKGGARGVRVFDDYGHHPNEIRATLKALKGGFREGRLHVIFQPHRYTRTLSLLEDFADCFWDADRVIMMPIYPAGERAIEGIDSRVIVEKMLQRGYKNVTLIEQRESIADIVNNEVSDGDIVITLGAGDVFKIGEALVERLRG